MFKLFFPVVMLITFLFCIFTPFFVLDKFYSLSFCSMVSMSLEWSFLSVAFTCMVLVVSYSVFLYSLGYMGHDSGWSKFIVLLFLFVVSMLVLSLSGNLFTSIIGWDGLGLTSLALIYFYNGWVSFYSGMITFLCNRFGDLLFITCIVLTSMLPSVPSTELSVLITVSALTKSAQYPFHIWLPLAMAAPTPVSSLVHSSTLVTAGLLVLMRFGCFLSIDVCFLMVFMGLMTVVFSGYKSLTESDMKKVVAYSTLIHLSMMVVFISMGDFLPCLIHLLCHAFMKSSLFMMSGYVIHNNSGYQDIRVCSISPIENPSATMILLSSLMSMVGVPFLSGFVSKEVMLSSYLELGSLSFGVLVIFLSVFFTSCYSSRLLLSFFKNSGVCLSLVSWDSNKQMVLPLLIGVLGSLSLGSVVILSSYWLSSVDESMETMMSEKLFVLVTVISGVVFSQLFSSSAISMKPVTKTNLISSESVTPFLEGHTKWLKSVSSGGLGLWKELKSSQMPSLEMGKMQFLKLFIVCVLLSSLLLTT